MNVSTSQDVRICAESGWSMQISSSAASVGRALVGYVSMAVAT